MIFSSPLDTTTIKMLSLTCKNVVARMLINPCYSIANTRCPTILDCRLFSFFIKSLSINYNIEIFVLPKEKIQYDKCCLKYHCCLLGEFGRDKNRINTELKNGQNLLCGKDEVVV